MFGITVREADARFQGQRRPFHGQASDGLQRHLQSARKTSSLTSCHDTGLGAQPDWAQYLIRKAGQRRCRYHHCPSQLRFRSLPHRPAFQHRGCPLYR